MTNLEKIYLTNVIIYKKPIGLKKNEQGNTFDTEKECKGSIEVRTIRLINGDTKQEIYLNSNVNLPIETQIKQKSDKSFYKIKECIKMATAYFNVYTYIINKG
ncbi:MAG TPA: hypothetical protein PK771_08370 [Spirochaetota bacterium]|nr:hypothetical protein [Spirochaetota bacterium]